MMVAGAAGDPERQDVQAEKAAIRTHIRRVRDSIPSAERAAMATQVWSRLFSLSAIQRATTVMVFYSFGSEIPTREVIQRLMDEGRRVLLPYMEGTKCWPLNSGPAIH